MSVRGEQEDDQDGGARQPERHRIGHLVFGWWQQNRAWPKERLPQHHKIWRDRYKNCVTILQRDRDVMQHQPRCQSPQDTVHSERNHGLSEDNCPQIPGFYAWSTLGLKK